MHGDVLEQIEPSTPRRARAKPALRPALTLRLGLTLRPALTRRKRSSGHAERADHARRPRTLWRRTRFHQASVRARAAGARRRDPLHVMNVMNVMTEPAQLTRIEIFPIKSLDALQLSESRVTAGGILENDRVYAIVDREGRVVNGKRSEQVHRLRCAFAPDVKELWLRDEADSSAARFGFDEPAPLERWLSEFFGFHVALAHDPQRGFPDDSVAFGPTIVSEQSLRQVREWYPELTLESVRRRFRTNLELDGDVPFCEDVLFGGPDELKPFRIGAVRFLGHNPCQRCVVPTRDPSTGRASRAFQKTFSQLRKEHLPEWSDKRRFNHFYRFAVNTSIAASEAGKRLRVGDTLTL
jgi:uncharacterized protein YcbX